MTVTMNFMAKDRRPGILMSPSFSRGNVSEDLDTIQEDFKAHESEKKVEGKHHEDQHLKWDEQFHEKSPDSPRDYATFGTKRHIPRRASSHHYRESMVSLDGSTVGTRKPLKIWYRTVVIRQSCHSHLAEELHRKDTIVNTISVAITAITSSSIFSSLSSEDGSATTNAYSSWALFAGVLAAINTVLLAIAKTCNWGRRGETHLAAFKDFTRLRFKLENLVGDKHSYCHHDGIVEKDLESWIARYEDVLDSEPIIPQEILEEIEEQKDEAGLKWTRMDQEV